MDNHESGNIEFLDNIETPAESFGSFHHGGICPSMGSSFLTIDTSNMSFEDDRAETNGSTSPENLTMSSGASVGSPLTPVGTGFVNPMYNAGPWLRGRHNELWHLPNIDAERYWPSSEGFHMDNCVMNDYSNDDLSAFQLSYFNLHVKPKSSHDPALSRAVFTRSSPQKDRIYDEPHTWTHTVNVAIPRTVEPSATFQNILPSSPGSSLEPITPLKHYRDTSSIFASSPVNASCIGVLASQWEDEETSMIGIHGHNNERSFSRTLRSSQNSEEMDELSSPCTTPSSKSGVNCEAIIPQNIFACSVAGCVDKNGKPKRFKRQEHKKRHEKTVHKRDAKFACWVRTGGKACGREFTRRDNLNSHLKKTHGRRSNNQRNSYVATLDEKSEYFDEKWQGQLTSDGLPIGHPRWPEIC